MSNKNGFPKKMVYTGKKFIFLLVLLFVAVDNIGCVFRLLKIRKWELDTFNIITYMVI